MKRSLTATLLTTAAIVAALATCSCHSAHRVASQLAGCYAFDRPVFNWFVMAPRMELAHLDSTNTIQLLASRASQLHYSPPEATDPLEVRAPILTDTTEIARHAGMSYWVFVPPDSIHLQWASGTDGWILRLLVRGDSLYGAAVQIVDHPVEPRLLNSLHAVRVPCAPSHAG